MQAVCTPHCSLKDDWLFDTETYTPSGTISVRLKLRIQVPTLPHILISPHRGRSLHGTDVRGSSKRSGLFPPNSFLTLRHPIPRSNKKSSVPACYGCHKGQLNSKPNEGSYHFLLVLVWGPNRLACRLAVAPQLFSQLIRTIFPSAFLVLWCRTANYTLLPSFLTH